MQEQKLGEFSSTRLIRTHLPTCASVVAHSFARTGRETSIKGAESFKSNDVAASVCPMLSLPSRLNPCSIIRRISGSGTRSLGNRKADVHHVVQDPSSMRQSIGTSPLRRPLSSILE
eukprot:6204838-Pleurochrysis_carterae.AAC.2